MDVFEIVGLKSPLMSSNMYKIRSNNNLILIDPWNSKELFNLIYQQSLKVDYIILTHEHYDHISGVNSFIEKFDCRVICNKECAHAIEDPKLNFSKYFDILREVLPFDDGIGQNNSIEPYTCSADITFDKYKTLVWNNHEIKFTSTPGHSKGSISIMIDDKYLFSGDSLLRDFVAITRFKGGNSKDYNEKSIAYFKTLPSDTLVYPGHCQPFMLKNKLSYKLDK